MSDATEHPTLPLPDGPAEPVVRPRRRWPWVLLVVVVLIAALVVAAELVARAVLPGIVRGIVVDSLDLPATQQLDVEAAGVLLPQLIGGSLDELRLSSRSVSLQGITGAVQATASDVSLRGGEIGDAQGTVSVDEEQFAALVERSALPVDEVAFQTPDIVASGTVQVLGSAVPLSLTVTPGADAGELLLTPVSVSLGGLDLDVAQLADRLGSMAEGIAGTQRICIADRLPAGLTLTGLEISGTRAVAEFAVDGRIGTDAALQEPGSC